MSNENAVLETQRESAAFLAEFIADTVPEPITEQHEFFQLLGAAQAQRGVGTVKETSTVTLILFGGELLITNIWTRPDKRGQGNAGRLLHRVCDAAYDTGIVLRLRANPLDENGLDLQQLGPTEKYLHFCRAAGMAV